MNTPGPWRVAPLSVGRYKVVASSDGRVVGEASGYNEQADLLAACERALYALKGREHDGFLRDAIKKARGE